MVSVLKPGRPSCVARGALLTWGTFLEVDDARPKLASTFFWLKRHEVTTAWRRPNTLLYELKNQILLKYLPVLGNEHVKMLQSIMLNSVKNIHC